MTAESPDAERKAQLMDQLTREWKEMEAQRVEIDAQHRGEIDAHHIERKLNRDIGRAQKLAEYVELGLNVREVGSSTGLKNGSVVRLLRYERFLKVLLPVGSKINEWKFRTYYYHQTNQEAERTLRGSKNLQAKLAYEHVIFQRIIDMLNEGSEPEIDWVAGKVKGGKTPEKKAKKEQLRLVTAEPKALRLFIRIKRREVIELYEDIREDVEQLIQLIGRDRNDNRILSPDSLGIKAERLKRRWRELAKALSIEDVSVEVVNE
jgi:hypothetical protein